MREWAGAALLAAVTLAGCVHAHVAAGAAAEPAAPQAGVALAGPASGGFAEGAGQEQTVTACTACHSATIITGKHYSADKWAEVVDQMIDRGAAVDDAQFDAIVGYLAHNYGPEAP